jgi:uncharacterized membrane protein
VSAARGYVEAALSALCFGAAPLFAKKGLLEGAGPFHGLMISLGAAFVVTLFVIFLFRQGQRISSLGWESLLFVLLAGVANTLAMVTYYLALKVGKVALVVPVTCTYPVFTMFFSILFMGKREPLDVWTVTGTLMVVAGVILTF